MFATRTENLKALLDDERDELATIEDMLKQGKLDEANAKILKEDILGNMRKLVKEMAAREKAAAAGPSGAVAEGSDDESEGESEGEEEEGGEEGERKAKKQKKGARPKVRFEHERKIEYTDFDEHADMTENIRLALCARALADNKGPLKGEPGEEGKSQAAQYHGMIKALLKVSKKLMNYRTLHAWLKGKNREAMRKALITQTELDTSQIQNSKWIDNHMSAVRAFTCDHFAFDLAEKDRARKAAEAAAKKAKAAAKKKAAVAKNGPALKGVAKKGVAKKAK